MKGSLLALLMATAVAIAGCASLQSSQNDQLIVATVTDGAVGVAVSKGIQPQQIANIAKALKALDSGQTATLPAVTAVLQPLVAKAGFNVAELAAVNTLLAALNQVIAQKQPAQVQATIQLVLDDVLAATALYGT